MDKWYVYFFPERNKEDPAIKIGYSKHPIKRLKQLQTGHPTKIGSEGWLELNNELDAQFYEYSLHQSFNKERIRKNGEWFKYNEKIKNYVESLYKKINFTRYFH